ncbi:hypothetical protein BurJ1DRAFT_1151 [Burkholderiales bacterium JOSHI_001]|nr:hypothetical protein BurJ1DRAFT_1151 [Burkholderiales bacterium JOSHI_001]
MLGMKLWRFVSAGGLLLAMAACGGGGGSAGDSLFGDGTTTGGGGGTASASDLVVVLDRSTVDNSGTQNVVATITAVNANRGTVAGVPVEVSVDNGAFVSVSGASTDTQGKVTATVSIGSNKTPRNITVTAKAGGVSRADAFAVTTAAGGGSGVATDLVVVLDKTSVDNSGTQTVVATITAVDANRATLAGIPVAVKVNNNAVVSVNSGTTDASGVVVATVAIGNDKTLRTVDVTASTDTLGRTQSFQVIGSAGGGGIAASDLVVVLDRSTLPNSGAESVVATVTALDANRNALAGAPVQVTVDAEAIATVSAAQTNNQGVVTADVSIGANKTQRNVTVTARSGAIVKSQVFQVTSAIGGGGGATAADLTILLNKTLIDSNGTDTATATITALDANRNAISGIPVVVTVDNNAVATVNAGSTSAQGLISAAITAGSDRSNRTVTITATAGAISRTATLTVAEGGGTVTPADMTLELSAAQVTNTGTESIIATVTTVDVRRNALPGVQVRFSIDNGGVVVPGALTTGADGRLIATARIGSDRSSRTVTVTATAGTFVRTGSFRVTGAKLASTAVPAVAAAGSLGNQIQYKLVDNNANPMAGQAITVVSSQGTTVTDKTGPNGDFAFNYNAPVQAGSITFTATAAGETDIRTVQVGAVAVPLPIGPIESKSISAAPNVVAVNTVGSTSNQVALRALFLGVNNKPVANVRVRFDLAGDANTIGGVMDVGTSTVYSGSDGVATANYIAGTRASPTNGLTLRACYSLADFTGPNDCPNEVTTTITVVQEALSVSIGTDELIQLGTGTYIKDFVVLVVDGAGVAKSDITISPSVDVLAYYKGFYEIASGRWTQRITLDENQGYTFDPVASAWVQTGAPLGTSSQGIGFPGPNNTVVFRQPSCPNDDVNRNGARDTGEDLNNNQSLDPRKADVSIRAVGSTKTAANGTVVLRLEYPRDYATWVDFEITVQAGGISGTEGRTRYVGTLYGRGNLPPQASVLTNVQASPAFVFSPYGRSASCQDAK